jgi:hypothetical protein
VARYLISFDRGWAATIAVACRCAQEVREFLPDPIVDEWLAR